MFHEILGNLLAGLGLFFIGVKLVGENTKQMTGRRFRQLVARLTKNSLLAGIWGIISGALMQSTTAVTFVVISLVSAGLIPVRRAMPIITWSNVGNSALVLLAVLDLRLAALYLLGFTGLCYYLSLDRSPRYRNIVGSLLGIGVLFLGLIHMKAGASPLKEIEWFTHLLAYTSRSYFLAFIAGGFLTFIAQSSTTVSVVAIALAKAGLLGWEQTAMIVYGANLGSGVSTWFMAANLRGTARQVAIFQVVFKSVGALILVPLFYLEVFGGVPLIRSLVAIFADDLGHQMACVFLIFQTAAAIPVSLFSGAIFRLLERLSPPTEEEVLSKPQFIYDQALEEPETAMELVAQEQLRISRHLPEYLDELREETSFITRMNPAALFPAANSVLKQIDAFTTDLLDKNHSREALEQIIRLQNRNNLLLSLNESLHSLGTLASRSRQSPALAALSGRLAEGLHLVLTTAIDTLETQENAGKEILSRLTSDRGDLVERLRKAILRAEHSLTAEDQQTLFTITSLFERVIWLLRGLGASIGSPDSGPDQA